MLTPFAVRTLAAAILATSLIPADAETVRSTNDLTNNRRTAAYIQSRAMLESLYRLGVEQDKKFGIAQECRTQYRVEPFSIAVLQPIDFPDDQQHPVKGIWNFRYQLQRCGESKFYNALFIASGNGNTPPAPRANYPGATGASALLVRDTLPAAVSNAVVKSDLKDCKEIDVFDMRVTKPPHDVVEGDTTMKGVWNETWTFRLCGQMVDVGLSFVPDAKNGGTQYVITSVKLGDSPRKQ